MKKSSLERAYERQVARREASLDECPSCKQRTRTAAEKAKGYQCRACTNRDEGAACGPYGDIF
jgi:ribosomal protein L37AE/L43A